MADALNTLKTARKTLLPAIEAAKTAQEAEAAFVAFLDGTGQRLALRRLLADKHKAQKTNEKLRKRLLSDRRILRPAHVDAFAALIDASDHVELVKALDRLDRVEDKTPFLQAFTEAALLTRKAGEALQDKTGRSLADSLIAAMPEPEDSSAPGATASQSESTDGKTNGGAFGAGFGAVVGGAAVGGVGGPVGAIGGAIVGGVVFGLLGALFGDFYDRGVEDGEAEAADGMAEAQTESGEAEGGPAEPAETPAEK